MARNFAIVYLEQALTRAPLAERFAQAGCMCQALLLCAACGQAVERPEL